MKKITFTESYTVFSPRKGYRKFRFSAFFPLIILLISGSLSVGVLTHPDGKYPAAFFMAMGVMLYFMMEIFTAYRASSGMMKKWKEELSILRSSPYMEEILKKAIIFDEIKRLICCFICCLTAGMCFIRVTEPVSVITFIISGTFFLYALLSIGVFLLRRFSSSAVFLINFYFTTFSAFALTAVLLMQNILDPLLMLFAIAAAAAVIPLIKITIKKVTGCRYE